jgi:hypothetical protein
LQFGTRATTKRKPFRVRLVQDCHTPAEDKVFFLLLNLAKDPKRRYGALDPDGTSLCWASQPEIARRVHMHENNVRTILRSLSAKLSIELVAEADRAEGKGRTWRIRTFRQILERRRAANLVWAIKSGGGQIKFVRSDDIERLLAEHLENESVGNDSVPTECFWENDYVPIDSISRKDTESIGNMGTDSFACKEVLVNRSVVNKTAAASPAVARFLPLVLKAVGFAAAAGSDFGHRVWNSASEARPDSSPEEVALIVERLWDTLVRSKTVENPLGLIISKIGSEVAAQLDRVRSEMETQREAERQQNAELVRLWTGILNDPAESDLHEQARAALREQGIAC